MGHVSLRISYNRNGYYQPQRTCASMRIGSRSVADGNSPGDSPPRGATPSVHLRLSLLENAYGFLNESLAHYRRTSRTLRAWPFALFHLTQSLELMLKQTLSNIHPIFIYEDVDRPKRTVSLEQALVRLETLGFPVHEKERRNILAAANYRNRVVHTEVVLNKFEWKNIYVRLFEFAHFFHKRHLGAELHAAVARAHWPVEARLMAYFARTFVVYNGVEVHRRHPKDIVGAQRIDSFSDGRISYKRITYGCEPGWLALGGDSYADTPCHDCAVVKGQYHTEGCDVEECPKCHEQLLGCACW